MGGEPRDRALSQLLFVGIARLTILTGSALKRAMSLRAKLGAGREPLTDCVTFNHCMEWLIFDFFGERAKTDMTLPPVASLTADQRDFRVFALQQGYWDYINFTGQLADCRLPSMRKALAEYLGVPAPQKRT